MNIEEFAQKLHDIFGFNIEITDDKMIITVTVEEPTITDEGEEGESNIISGIFTLPLKFLQEKIEELHKMEIIGETAIYYQNHYEFLINVLGPTPYRFFRLQSKTLENEDKTNQIQYKLSTPSDLYFLHFLNILQNKDLNLIRKSVSGYQIADSLEKFQPSNDFLTFVKKLLRRFITIQISSRSHRSVKDYEDFGNAYLFQQAYNLNIPITHVRFLEEYLSPARISTIRRGKIGEIDPPRRIYIADLVSHYMMAISTDSPALQYLSFYHIMEYFFERVYTEQLIQSIKNEITKPDFSYTRDADISKLVKHISKNLKVREEEFIFNEQEALMLTLKKFIPDISKIREYISNYNPDLLSHYKTNDVHFSKGDKVDFNDANIDNIYPRLAARIYKSRNAIVHSKETMKPIYIPFKHDKDLFKEIPLVRFISEEIIISSSPNLISS